MPRVGGSRTQRGSIAAGQAAVDLVPSLEAARGAWTSLAERGDNVFSTWEWAAVWWRHFGAGRTLKLTGIREATALDGVAGREIALLPLYNERRAGIRIDRFLGHGVADQLGPVCGTDDQTTAAQVLSTLGDDADVFVADRLPEGRDWEQDLHGQVIHEAASPTISLADEGSWEDYLGRRSANFRQQVRRRARRLEVRYRLATDPARLSADFDALIALHSARWGAESGAFAGARRAFHHDFAACALERGWLRLWLAECEGQPVAAWYGFRYAGVESYYQAGRDPAWDRFGVGAGILEHSIREAFHDGMHEYRMLLGDERYKSRYATSTPSVRTVVVPHGRLGRAVVGTATAVARSAWGRRLLNSDRFRNTDTRIE